MRRSEPFSLDAGGPRRTAASASPATSVDPAGANREGVNRSDEDRGGGGVLGFLAELPVLMVVAFLLAVVLKTFLVQAFWIPSESMVPTLDINDRVLVNKLAYTLGEPERGDIVVFSDPASVQESGLSGFWDSLTSGFGLTPPGEEDFIKRIIALPGETVEIRDGTVYVDGEAVPERLATEGGYLGGVTSDYGPVTVSEDEYFVMGDNRPFSADSRSLLGTIPADHLVGRAFVLIWPLHRAQLLGSPGYGLGGPTASAAPTAQPVAAVVPAP